MNGNGMKEDTMGRNRFLVTESRELDDELIAAEDADGARMEPVLSGRPRHAPTRDEMAAAARTLVDAKTAALGTVLFAAMVDDLIPDGQDVTDIHAHGRGVPPANDDHAELVEADPTPAEAISGASGDEPHGRDGESVQAAGDVDAAKDPNAPEGDDWRTRGQFGARAPDTYYRNLPAFVEGFMAHVFSYHQSTNSQYRWVSDWWRWPQLVFPLDAMWRAYEAARRQPNGMMVFYMQAGGLLDRVFNPDRGIVASLDAARVYTDRGEPLPCTPPPADWRARITAQLAIGDDTPTATADNQPDSRAHTPRAQERSRS